VREEVITNKNRDEIARVAAKPIIDHLMQQAYEEFVEEFCLPRCGHRPEQTCEQATLECQLQYSHFIIHSLERYGRLN